MSLTLKVAVQTNLLKVDQDILEKYQNCKVDFLRSKGYCSITVGQRRLFLHTLITGCKGMDHADRDPRNCLRSNLRSATGSQNNTNKGLTKANTSGYKGVSKCGNKWQATISIDYHNVNLGKFDNAIDAARAYNHGAVAAYGEFAVLNKL